MPATGPGRETAYSRTEPGLPRTARPIQGSVRNSRGRAHSSADAHVRLLHLENEACSFTCMKEFCARLAHEGAARSVADEEAVT